MADSISQPHTINKYIDAVYPSFALLAGLQLDLFTSLDRAPLSADQIARAVGVKTAKLRPLLFTLVVAGLLNFEEGRFANKLESGRYLVRGKPDYMGGRFGLIASNWKRLFSTADTIRAGKPPVDYDDPERPEELISVFRGLYPGAVKDGKRLMEQHDFSSFQTLLDVGGGSGGLAITISKANPQLKATVLDLPSVTPITHKFVQEANADNQVNVVQADAVRDEINGNFDVVVARHVVQVLSEEDARAFLRNLFTAVRPGGVLHLIGWILDNSRLTPENIVAYNLILLTSNEHGQAYTELEYRDWMEDAGFVNFQRTVMPDGNSFITVQKPE